MKCTVFKLQRLCLQNIVVQVCAYGNIHFQMGNIAGSVGLGLQCPISNWIVVIQHAQRRVALEFDRSHVR
jgi:hypothetical protein